MKLSTILATLTVLAAGASAAPSSAAGAPGPFSELANKNAEHWKLYSEPKGTDLSTAKPKYHKCKVTNPGGRDLVFKNTFENNKDFEFQQFYENCIGVNCIDCSPPVLGNYYFTKIDGFLTCEMYEDTPILQSQ